MPRVSVLMTVYNGREFLCRSIGSILKQTYSDWELVVVDDGSSDGSGALLASMAADEPRMRVFVAGRLGRYPALNYGLNQCLGEYIAVMDADDYSYPMRLERQVAYMVEHPEVAGLGTGYMMIDEQKGTREARLNPEGDYEIRRALATYIPICHTSGMFRREAARNAGGYIYNVKPPYMAPEDLRLWINLARGHKLANLPEVLVDHYIHKKSFRWSGGVFRNHLALMRINGYAIRVLGLPMWLSLLTLLRPIYAVFPRHWRRVVRQMIRRRIDVVVK